MRFQRFLTIAVLVFTPAYFCGVLLLTFISTMGGANHGPWFGTWLDVYFSKTLLASLIGAAPLLLVSLKKNPRSAMGLAVSVLLFLFYLFYAFPLLSD